MFIDAESGGAVKLYDFAEAAELLGVAEGTLRHWVARRQVRHHRIGGGKLVRFTDDDLAAALQPVEPLPPTPRRRRRPRLGPDTRNCQTE